MGCFTPKLQSIASQLPQSEEAELSVPAFSWANWVHRTPDFAHGHALGNQGEHFLPILHKKMGQDGTEEAGVRDEFHTGFCASPSLDLPGQSSN